MLAGLHLNCRTYSVLFLESERLITYVREGERFSISRGFGGQACAFEVGSEVWGRATSLLIVYVLQALKGTITIALLFESGSQSPDVLNKSEMGNCIHMKRIERGCGC